MRVLSWKPFGEFAVRHPAAEQPLRSWFKLMERSPASNLAELKQTFGSVDYVPVKQREIYVFNVGGNKYRVMSEINFKWRVVFIQCVLTHAEYDTG